MPLTRAVLQGSLCKLSPWRKQPVHPIRDQGTPFIRFLYHRAPALRNAGFWALLGLAETVVPVVSGKTGRHPNANQHLIISGKSTTGSDVASKPRPPDSQADRTGFLVDSADGKA